MLHLHRPPLLVAVASAGEVLPALLIASRGSRRYVQLSRGVGSNHLVWVAADDLRPGGEPVPVPVATPGAAPPGAGSRGLPWARTRGS